MTKQLPEDLLQWVFNCDRITREIGHHVNTRYLCQALRDLRTASRGSNPHEVRLAWQMLCDSAGPVLTGLFISSGAWLDFCPQPIAGRDASALATVWHREDKSVVARAQFQGDVPVGVRFDIE